MAVMVCKCGEHLSNSNNPEIQYKVFSDDEWIALHDLEDSGKKVTDWGWPKISFWKCTNCHRLHIFRDNLDTKISVYKLEEGQGDWYSEETTTGKNENM